MIESKSVSVAGQYYELDITSCVNSQLSGDDVISILLNDTSADNQYADFLSKENVSNKPELVAAEGEISFNQLEKLTESNAASLNRFLKVLMEMGYLTKNLSGKYVLGLKLFMILHGKSYWQTLIEKSTPVLRQISERFGMTVLLVGLSSQRFTVLNKAIHPDNLAMQGIGEDKRDFILSPWGFLYLSHIPEIDRNLIIKKSRRENKTGLVPPCDVDLNRLITFASENGYSDDDASIMKDVRRFGAPVYGVSGEIIAALGVGSFSSIIKADRVQDLISTLKQKAQELSDYLKRMPIN